MTDAATLISDASKSVSPWSPFFETCREAVAKELKWPVDQVMNWEVRSFICMRPEKAEKILSALSREDVKTCAPVEKKNSGDKP